MTAVTESLVDVNVRFTDPQLDVVRFCAIECRLQQSGEESVYWMLRAWTLAQGRAKHPPTEDDLLALGRLIEPRRVDGYRRVGVRVGWNIKPDPREVPRLMETLLAGLPHASPAEFFREFEEVHPFVDGNGRTGQILFNWLNGTLDAPVWAPNFWKDERRIEGEGA